jgi:hypothetical protein
MSENSVKYAVKKPADFNDSTPEFDFHLANSINELHASVRLLSDADPRKSVMAELAAALNVMRGA